MSQVFKYRTNFFELHIPIAGKQNILYDNFWKTIQVYVYFHKSTKNDIDLLYKNPNTLLKNKEIKLYNDATSYEKINTLNYINQKKNSLRRDQLISFSYEDTDIKKLIYKISNISKNNLFTDNIYNEFKRRLSPSEWIKTQGIPTPLDKYQLKCAYTQSNCKTKIKGVAGCGKTSILAYRALDAYTKHKSVLILTYNNTLKSLIRDKLSHYNHFEFQDKANINHIEISTYHNIFISQLHYCNIYIPKEEYNNEELYKNYDIFKEHNTMRFDSILIDEIQDYYRDWIFILNDFFLEKNGEIVLFGDIGQNIYKRALDQQVSNQSSQPITTNSLQYWNHLQGFGVWYILNKSYRNYSPILTSSFSQFQDKYLISKYKTLTKFSTSENQMFLTNEIVQYKIYNFSNIINVAEDINNIIKNNNLNCNDITILSSQKNILKPIENFFSQNEKTMTTFANTEEIKEIINKIKTKQDKLENYMNKKTITLNDNKQITQLKNFIEKDKKRIDRLDSFKKYCFQLNSGLLKFATIHSFKGMENPTIFCILTEQDSPEMVYTAITRAKNNLIIYDVTNSQYKDFFEHVYGTAIILN